MRRLLLALGIAASLALPLAASAWEDVRIFVTFPARDTTSQARTIDFHVMLGGSPLDLSTVGRRLRPLEPTVVFRRGGERVVAQAHRTARAGVYRVRVLLPTGGAWTYSFGYDGLVRSFAR